MYETNFYIIATMIVYRLLDIYSYSEEAINYTQQMALLHQQLKLAFRNLLPVSVPHHKSKFMIKHEVLLSIMVSG